MSLIADYGKTTSGEIIKSKPHNTDVYTGMNETLVMGRMVGLDLATGNVKQLDGTTPADNVYKIIGTVKRDMMNAIENGDNILASKKGVEVHTFGFFTVETTTAAVPFRHAKVYAINATGTESGKITQDSGESGAQILEGAEFWEARDQGSKKVWLIRSGI
jgi:hypothetical protein